MDASRCRIKTKYFEAIPTECHEARPWCRDRRLEELGGDGNDVRHAEHCIQSGTSTRQVWNEC